MSPVPVPKRLGSQGQTQVAKRAQRQRLPTPRRPPKLLRSHFSSRSRGSANTLLMPPDTTARLFFPLAMGFSTPDLLDQTHFPAQQAVPEFQEQQSQEGFGNHLMVQNARVCPKRSPCCPLLPPTSPRETGRAGNHGPAQHQARRWGCAVTPRILGACLPHGRVVVGCQWHRWWRRSAC